MLLKAVAPSLDRGIFKISNICPYCLYDCGIRPDLSKCDDLPSISNELSLIRVASQETYRQLIDTNWLFPYIFGEILRNCLTTLRKLVQRPRLGMLATLPLSRESYIALLLWGVMADLRGKMKEAFYRMLPCSPQNFEELVDIGATTTQMRSRWAA